jgi:glycosyltransferase involved in cell wall biosynthesis
MKELIIFTMNYGNPYTGGIRFTNSFADFAKKNYPKITLIDFAQLPRLIRRFRLITIIYFCYFFLSRRNFHIVVDHSLHFRLLLPLLLSPNRYSVLFFQKFYHLRNHPLTLFIQYLTEKFFLINANQIIVPSQSAKNDVLKFGLRKEVIHIVSPTVSIKGDRVIKTEFHGNLLFLGQVETWKGIDILIRALSMIKEINFHLDVVGRYNAKSKYFKYLQKLIAQYSLENNIQFHGQKTGTALKELFQKADIFTFPSRSETFGIVLLEAISFGLPIVASAIPSTCELIKDNENGILCPVEDPKGFANALRLILTNSELRKKLSEANLERSKTILSEEEVVAKVFNLVRPYLESNP